MFNATILSDSNSEVVKTLHHIEDTNTRMEINRTNDLEQLKTEIIACVKSTKNDAGLGAGSVKDHFHRALEFKSISEADIAQLSKRLDLLSSKLSSLENHARSIAAEQAVLDTLRFRQMGERFAQVVGSAPKTFDWIFEGSDSNRQRESHFTDWLQSKSGVFWIKGKAGSGKSTLMKYLYNHDKTKMKLQQWSNGKRLILSSFFFWGSGTTLQKSQEGLLRSLLYEILRQCPDVIPAVCSRYGLEPQAHDFNSWTVLELVEVFNKLQQLQDLATNFVFFIDGLDEYEGEYTDLIDVLQELAEHRSIKVCASSRPYYVFKDAFGQFSERQLVLEDFTANDIREYVEFCFKKSTRFQELCRLDTRYSNFIQEIVDRAQGVFLWVTLVVRSLLKGFTNADDIPDLQERLRELPPTLEGMFRQMFDRIEPVYREQTAQVFLIALVAPNLPVMALSFLNDAKLAHIIDMPISPSTREEGEDRYQMMERRLAGRCDGLLETSDALLCVYNQCNYFRASVVFMHRSVRDFLLLKDMQAMLHDRAGPFDARETFCKTIIAMMKSFQGCPCRYAATPNDDLWGYLAYSAHELEIENKALPTNLLNEAERVLREHPYYFLREVGRTAFLGIAIEYGLNTYIQSRLDIEPSLIRARDKPLLSYALEQYRHKLETYYSLVEMLLARGASPEQEYDGHSVWDRFIHSTCRSGRIPLSDKKRAELLEVVRLLISYGANVNDSTWIVPNHRKFMSRPKPQNVTRTAKEALIDMFGIDEVELLLKRAPSRSNGHRKGFRKWLGWKWPLRLATRILYSSFQMPQK